MKSYGPKIASLFGLTLLAGATAAYADALPTPSMAGPLAANASPMKFDAGPLGDIYVTGAISGLALYQSNHSETVGDHETLLDFTNAQVAVQKTDGLIQFYLQAGGYSLPALGLPYVRAATATNTFGPVPVAYLKLVPTDTFNIEAGKLPTLIGAEYTFTFENLNIERGLLWNQEPAVSRGVQANYTIGPVALSAAWTDGAYTNQYNQLSGLATWTISSSDSISVDGSGDLGRVNNPVITSNAPYCIFHGGCYEPAVDSEEVYNLMWTHTSGPWTITPYAQYTNVPNYTFCGWYISGTCVHQRTDAATSTWGGAVLANYAFDSNWSLGGRVEYIEQNGGRDTVLYGHNSSAWSFTVTPTYQYKVLFARMDVSYVDASSLHHHGSSLDGAPGPGFGPSGTDKNQTRVLLEVGVLF